MIFYWINPCENAHWSIFTLHPRTIKESGGKIQADALIALKGYSTRCTNNHGEKMSLEDRLHKVFVTVFDNDSIEFKPELTAERCR